MTSVKLMVCLGVMTLCLLDVILECTLGNEWTISWNLLGLELGNPIFGLGLVYSLCTLVGHLCLPRSTPDLTGIWLYTRMIIGLLPILGTFVYMAVGPSVTVYSGWTRVETIRHGIFLWIFAGVGLLNGAIGVPQHLDV